MRSIITFLCTLSLLMCTFGDARAQSLLDTARKAEQHAKELRQQEAARYADIIDSWDLSKYDAYISDYPNGSQTPEIRKRANEVKLYRDAVNAGTVAALESYLANTKLHHYDKEARTKITAVKKRVELDAWQKVKKAGTLEAYHRFITDNPTSGYLDEAKKEINRLEGDARWNEIKNSTNAKDFADFLVKYPNASTKNEANNRLHQLRGVEYYNRGDFAKAYNEFCRVSPENITAANRDAYNIVMQRHDFEALGTQPSEKDIDDFARKYPNNPYLSQLSNYRALARARSFSIFSTQYDYDTALSYARDNATKEIVRKYIRQNKGRQTEAKRAQKARQREENGGTVAFGIEIGDLGIGQLEDYTLLYYNAGVKLRFGNYADRVQFLLGLKFGVMAYGELDSTYSYYDDYSDDEMETKFQLPVEAVFRLNLCKVSSGTWMFMQGSLQYNAVKAEYISGDGGWGAGLGFAGKEWDFSLSYRNDFGGDHANPWFISASVSYYFPIK